MGAGKTTLGREVARAARPAVRRPRRARSSARRARPIAELFASAARRRSGSSRSARDVEALAATSPAVARARRRRGRDRGRSARLLRERASPSWSTSTSTTAWERSRGSDRPLAQDEAAFRRAATTARRRSTTRPPTRVRDDVDDVVLAAAGVHVEPGALERLGELVPGDGAGRARRRRARRRDPRRRRAARARRAAPRPARAAAPGEEAKTRRRRASGSGASSRLDRDGTLVALGGGCDDRRRRLRRGDYLRGIAVGRRADDARRPGGRGDRRQDGDRPPGGKNLVGAFHWPARTVIDPALLATLPERGARERARRGRQDGPARRRAALGAAARRSRCAAARRSRRRSASATRTTAGDRAQLNLGHTFAHALEAAADYELPHGERGRARAARRAAALRALDTTSSSETLAPEPVRVDRERAWAALRATRRASAGRRGWCCSMRPGKPRARRRAARGRGPRGARRADRR